jgi:hypothetical protein
LEARTQGRSATRVRRNSPAYTQSRHARQEQWSIPLFVQDQFSLPCAAEAVNLAVVQDEYFRPIAKQFLRSPRLAASQVMWQLSRQSAAWLRFKLWLVAHFDNPFRN